MSKKRGVLEGIQLASAKRLTGLAQLGNNLSGLVDKEGAKKRSEFLAEIMREANAQSDELSGFGKAGEIAGDPLNFLPFGVLGKGAKLAQYMGAGALTGGVAGLTSGQDSASDGLQQNVKDAATGAVIGTAFGAISPAINKGVSTLGDLGAGMVNRVMALSGNEAAQNRVARDIQAKLLSKDNMQSIMSGEKTAKDVLSGLQKNQLGLTLGEATQSPSVLAREKALTKTTGEPSSVMREYLRNRNETVIPEKLKAAAAPLKKAGEESSALYEKIRTDVDNKFSSYLDEYNKILNETGDFKVANNSEAAKSLRPFLDAYDLIQKEKTKTLRRLREMGNVKNPESLALKQQFEILDAASKRRDPFSALLDAKKQLGQIFIEGADKSVQKQANNVTLETSSNIDSILESMSPDYAFAKNLNMQGRSGKSVLSSLEESKIGDIRALYYDLASSPEKMRTFMRGLTAEQQQQWSDIFSEIHKIERSGFGGSDTAYNIEGISDMTRDNVGIDPRIITPSGIQRFMGDVANAGIGVSLAKQSISPDAAALERGIKKYTSSVFDSVPTKIGASLGVPAATYVTQDNNTFDENVVNQMRNDPRVLDIMSSPDSEGADSKIIEQMKNDPRVMEIMRGDSPQSPQSSLPQTYMDRVAMVESGGDPNAQAATSSASGLYQFTDATWNSAVDRFGKKYGITRAMKNDPAAQSKMMEYLTADNARILENRGIEPTDENLYFAHFMGAPAATKAISKLGTGVPAARLFPSAAKANQTIFFDNSGNPRSIEDVYDIVTSKVRV